MTCSCMTLMGEKLAEHNTRLVTTFGWPRNGGEMFTRPKLDVEKIETRKRVGPVLAIPTYCPFCGTKYDDSGAKATGQEGGAL